MLLRGLLYEEPDAVEWIRRIDQDEVRAAWPAHLYAEVANTLVTAARTERIDLVRAVEVFDLVRSIDADVKPTEQLGTAAIAVGLERNLSAYDACYVVLAETLDATLVTADRRLAAATATSVLI